MNTGYFGNVAILGYDPVAYFTDRRATMGSPRSEEVARRHVVLRKREHRDAFISEPVRYASQFGGMQNGRIRTASANIDPEAWRIVDGKLYLFSGKEGLSDFDAAPAPS